MLTQCPNCRARTKLSDDHDRARVRCSECGRVFVARADESGAVPGRASLGLFLGALAGVLALIVLAVFLRAGGENGAPDGPASAPAPASK
jgi:predicted Zn finger-like uncharacterized protein